ncbi:MAG: HDOD domain-containing protein [Melioribacteraceae bacterium]|nr:HDOD domain-containing protein [Melioribacteraceae bacterium]
MDEKILEEKRKKTKLVLSNVYNLPAMSSTMMEVSKLLDDPTTNTATLSKKIGKDQGIATKILSIANSPLYGLRRRVSTIDFAILVIGFIEIKNIILALSMMESFKNKTDKYMDQKEFWLHSLMTGTAAKRIAEDLDCYKGGEAFVAGLLHDLGIPVIHKYFHSSFVAICERVENEEVPFLTSELEQLGYTHQDVGKFLGEKWNLPASLCNVISKHHTPSLLEDPNDKTLAAIVHLADYMTQRLEVGSFYWDKEFVFDEKILEVLKFENMDALDEFVDKYKGAFEEELKLIKI